MNKFKATKTAGIIGVLGNILLLLLKAVVGFACGNGAAAHRDKRFRRKADAAAAVHSGNPRVRPQQHPVRRAGKPEQMAQRQVGFHGGGHA